MKNRLVCTLILFLTVSTAWADVVVPQNQTTGLTSITVPIGGQIPEDSVCRMPLYVFAFNHDLAVALWRITVTTRRIGSDDATLIQNSTKDASATASTWLAVVSLAQGGDMQVTLTGGIGQTVDWLPTNDERFCMSGALP